MHFLSIDADRIGRADAQPNSIASNRSHDDPNLLVNHDRFTDAPRKH
jgi:hypothetical protein